MTTDAAMKRVLIVAPEYSVTGSAQWLPEELARELAGRGHHVRVIARDMIKPRPIGKQPSAPGEPEVFSVGVTRRADGRLARRMRLPIALLRQRLLALKWAADLQYDLVIYFTIAWTSRIVPHVLRRRGFCRQSVLVLWDFFPVHQYAIGHISGWLRPLQPLFYALERRAIMTADTVALMSEAGRKFLGSYFPTFTGGTAIIPPWGADSPVRAVPPARFVAVFGGQLGPGRGLEDILSAAELLAAEGSDIRISIFGDGPLVPWIRGEIEAKSLDNVTYGGRLPRDQYLQAIASASVGIAATVSGVPSPSFPSKIVDYARIGLPVLASAEDSTDVGEIIVARGAGWTCRAGHPDEMAGALRVAAAAHRSGELAHFGAMSRRFFETDLDVRAAADRFLDLTSNAS